MAENRCWLWFRQEVPLQSKWRTPEMGQWLREYNGYYVTMKLCTHVASQARWHAPATTVQVSGATDGSWGACWPPIPVKNRELCSIVIEEAIWYWRLASAHAHMGPWSCTHNHIAHRHTLQAERRARGEREVGKEREMKSLNRKQHCQPINGSVDWAKFSNEETQTADKYFKRCSTS